MRGRLLGLIVVVALLMAVPAYAALVDMVPQDAPLVFSVNITKLLQVPTVRKFFDETMSAAEKMGGMDDFVTRTGIKVDRDIHNMMVFLGAGKDAATGQPPAGVLIDGAFSTAKIVDLIKTDADLVKNAKLQDIHGFSGLASTLNANGNGVFLNDNTVALGSMGMLDAVTTVAAGKGKALSTHPAFGNLLNRVNTALTAWAGVVVSPEWKAEAMKSPVTVPMADLKAVVVGLDLEKGFVFHMTGELENKDQLKKFMDALDNYLAAAQAWAQGTPEVQEMLKLARVEGKDATARLSIVMSKHHFDKLMTSLGQRLEAKTPKK